LCKMRGGERKKKGEGGGEYYGERRNKDIFALKTFAKKGGRRKRRKWEGKGKRAMSR